MNLKLDGGILPLGYKASGISAGIKKSGKKDLGLLFSEAPCVASGLFTANAIKAAPVLLSQKHVKSKAVHALVVNSGNANCMTGAQGEADAWEMARVVADRTGVAPGQVLVASTGIIGKPLPMEKVRSAIPSLVEQLGEDNLSAVAQAMMTTDTFPKEVCGTVGIGGTKVTISGIAKGAGMIAPQLKSATMLVFLLTDAEVSRPVLDAALKAATDDSFHAITIDGCMSTNDTVLALANGEAGHELIRPGSEEAVLFSGALRSVCVELAKSIVRDAEGATKFIEICVRGAKSVPEAKALGMSVANSLLFKCAMFGADPNWGRIAAALGAAAARLDWKRLDIAINKIAVFRDGKPQPVADKNILAAKTALVEIDLNSGSAEHTVYTSDLSYDYVKINAEYN